MTFRVGQKVMAFRVEGDLPTTKRSLPRLSLDQVYIVREIDMRGVNAGIHSVPCMRLDGIYGPASMTNVGLWENGYRADRFRPIVERKTDISIFTKMLTGNRENIDA